MPTVNESLLSLRTPPAALGLTPEGWADAVALLIGTVPLTYSDEQAQWYVQAEMFDLEAGRWRQEISSGSGAEGSFSVSEISARMSAAEARRDEQRAALKASLPSTGTGRRRGSGSIPAVVEV